MISKIKVPNITNDDTFTTQINTHKNCSNEFIQLLDEEVSPLEDRPTHAWIMLVGDSSIGGSIFLSKKSSDDNPIMIVKGTDIDGGPLEIEVEIKNVNPKNASIIEMIALDGYLTEKEFTPLPKKLASLHAC